MKKSFYTRTSIELFDSQQNIAKRHISIFSLFLTLLLLSACQSLPTTDNTQTEQPTIYTLGPGDKVRVTVYQQKNLSGIFEVDSSGRISLPLLRGVKALGLSLPDLEDLITNRLKEEQFINPKVSIDLDKSRPICILGEVNKPGCFPYTYGMRAATAIALAGGYTYRAKQNILKLMHPKGGRTVAYHSTFIYPGDVIEVDERLF